MKATTPKQLDLTSVESPKEAAHMLRDWLVEEFGLKEVWLMDPARGEECGYGPYWRVGVEGFFHEWGVYATLGGSFVHQGYGPKDKPHEPEVLMVDNPHWYGEPYHSFDVGFIPCES